MNARKALDDPTAEEAIEWMVLLRSGEATPDDYQRLSAWRVRPGNAQAWERIQGMLQRSFAPVLEVDARAQGQAQAVERIVSRPAPAGRRKVLRSTLALAIAGIGTGILVNRFHPLLAWRSDLHTATGERQRVDLPDGSSLVLNARTAVDIDYRPGLRRIRLQQVELIATVAADPARPFVVETEHGQARALGTRFLVRHEAQRSLALVLEHSIRVDTAAGEDVLQAGQAVFYNARAIERAAGDMSSRAAWVDGMLVVDDQPLADVVEALRPYRAGYVRVSPAASQLRVLGAFPLDDTDNLLRSLAQTMPISVRHVGPLVLIDMK
ncbi:FecR family protein [Herbaspirillum sp. YR522]|uniref:FecR family protein n=1 Tax=Herbaspirillum sp. YR522 TaxID=1144342 RepID=UPI00026FCDB5|nr:FecR family protein [Herbaspirillum sp. YR522]EJM97556.1 Fe2+-dicitrate sensor, membrane component [Herbaspirillum sp. YR522]